MELSKYDIIDAYTLEELRRTYHASDSKGRIRLLQKFYRADKAAPFEIALLAVDDPHVEVRQWIARHGKYVDYREMHYVDKQVIYEHPDLNLEDRLKNDPDLFVRACLRENPTVFDSFSFITRWGEFFHEATHLERLALVRNPNVYEHLIERIFDSDDQELEINLEERKELALAFLTNKEALASSKADAALVGHPYPPDGSAWYSANRFLRTLWELASKWPKESKIQPVVYRCVPAEDAIKAEIYRTCDVPVWRQMILENCNADDTHTIELGMRDSDDLCRSLAASRARQTIDRAQATRPPKDPEELFGYEGRQGNFLEDKIDFIGKKLLEVAEHLVTVNDELRQVTHTLFGFKAVLSLVAIGVGVTILLSLLLRLFK